MKILGGTLNPVPHDGSTIDLVYGVDANGFYMGLVPAAQATLVVDRPPPRGQWQWVNSAWVPYTSAVDRAAAIDQQRDEKLALGLSFNGRVWYTDPTFTTHVQAFLTAFSEGILPPGATVPVRGKDKVIYRLTRAELQALAGALMTYVQGVYQWSWDQKALIQQ
jgi:hypothetical protein